MESRRHLSGCVRSGHYNEIIKIIINWVKKFILLKIRPPTLLGYTDVWINSWHAHDGITPCWWSILLLADQNTSDGGAEYVLQEVTHSAASASQWQPMRRQCKACIQPPHGRYTRVYHSVATDTQQPRLKEWARKKVAACVTRNIFRKIHSHKWK